MAKNWIRYINMNFPKWVEPLFEVIRQKNPRHGKKGLLKKPTGMLLTELVEIAASPELLTLAAKNKKEPIQQLRDLVGKGAEEKPHDIIREYIDKQSESWRTDYYRSVGDNSPRAELVIQAELKG